VKYLYASNTLAFSLLHDGPEHATPVDEHPVSSSTCAVQEDGTENLSAVLSKPAWSQWILDVMAKPREYNNKTRMRVNVRAARRMNWASESSHMIQMISERWPALAATSAAV
jgi:hypothetical protein